MRLGLLFIASAFVSTTALAAQTIDLDFHHREVQPEGTLYLKGKVSEERPDLNINSFDLLEVTLRAKSKQGRGTAKLEIDGDRVDAQTIPGRPDEFGSRDRGSYYEIVLRVPHRHDTEGTWQIKLEGNIKVDSATLTIRRERNGQNNRLQPVFRVYNSQKPDHMVTLDPNEARHLGYMFEGVAFQAAARQTRDLVPLYRCLIRGVNRHFASLDVGCEGQSTESILGFIATRPQRGLDSPIYRCFSDRVKSHLITSNPNECTENSYRIESVLGFAAN